MSETPLQIRMTGDGDTRVVEVTGEVDLNSSPELRGKMLELIEQHKGRLVVDLAGVDYMDSSGVGTMVELKRRVERQGGHVVPIPGTAQRDTECVPEADSACGHHCRRAGAKVCPSPEWLTAMHYELCTACTR